MRRAWRPGARKALLIGTVALVVIAPPLLAGAYWRYVNVVPPFRPSFPPPPEPNGYDRATSILQDYRAPILFSEPWQNAPESKLAPAIARGASKAAAIRRTFSLQWSLRPPEERGSANRNFGAMATHFAMESRLERLRGHPSVALRCSIDAMEWGRCNGDLYGQGYQELGMEQAERCLDAVPLPGLEQQLQRVRRLRLTWPRALPRVEINRQVALTQLTAAMQAASVKSLWEQLDEAEQVSNSSLAASKPFQFFNHDWETWKCVLTPRSQSVAALNRYYDALRIRVGAPVRDGYGPPDPADRWAARFATGQMGGYRWEWPRHNLALLETALAVRIFRLRHGRYPANVSEIDRDLLPEVPLDIWDQPVVVRLRKGRPLIYSIARDGVDDGGRPGKPGTFIELGTGDAVWGMLCSADWLSKRN